MFDISLTETLLVLIVGLVVLDVHDMIKIYRYIVSFITKVRASLANIHEYILSFDSDKKEEQSTIVDLYGNVQPIYSIKEVKDFLKKNEQEETKETV